MQRRYVRPVTVADLPVNDLAPSPDQRGAGNAIILRHALQDLRHPLTSCATALIKLIDGMEPRHRSVEHGDIEQKSDECALSQLAVEQLHAAGVEHQGGAE